MDNLQICAARAPQAAVAAGLGDLVEWRESNRREMSKRADTFGSTLDAAPAWCVDSLGAYFAYVKHPFAGQGSEHVARRLAIEAGVLTVPGMYFGENQQQHLRMAFANADSATIGLLAARLNTLA
jgi:aspartate/methionine/tyrosine aminotransferase